MWVGGIGVSAGYLNLPEKTAERWKPDPFVGKGKMMFNTCDLGRWRKDGQLDHLGRADDQVKINGFRVELDGVAAAMLTYEPVQSATAMVIGTELWGFVTPSTIDLSLVRNATAKVQPYYAVPRQYLAMDDFPITRNGKIDKRSLAGLAEGDSYEGGVVKRFSARDRIVHHNRGSNGGCTLNGSSSSSINNGQQPSFKLVETPSSSPLSPEAIPRSSTTSLEGVVRPVDQKQMAREDGPESFVLNEVPRVIYVDAV